jgi:hypothetical protein
VHVYDNTVVHSAVPIGTYETVGEFVSPEETARRLAEAGIVIADGSRSGSVSRV